MNGGGLGLLGIAIAISLGLAITARLRGSQSAIDFQLAGQRVGVITNASAICGDYVSAASFLGVAASVYASGIDGAWQAVGFAAGFVPVVLFVAAPLRRFGDRSLSDFLGRRFESERVRISAVVVVEMVILIYLVPQAVGGGIAWDLLVHSSLPGLDGYESGIVVSTLVIGVLVTVGGMRGTTWTQALQFVLLLSILVWVAVMLVGDGFSYGEAVRHASSSPLAKPTDVTDLAGTYSLTPVVSHIDHTKFAFFDTPGGQFGSLEYVSLMFTLVLGTAGLPHVMNRFFTAPSGKAARVTTVWVIGLIGIFYSLAVMAGTASRSIISARAPQLPWLQDLTVDGVLKVPEHSLLVLGRLYGNDIGLSLMATGAIIAIMSTVGGLLLASSASWGYDIYERHINPHATRRQSLRAGQFTVIVMAVLAAATATMLRPDRLSGSTPSIIASLVTAAFALSASTLAPAVMLGIWWKRASADGIFAGLVVGGSLSTIAMVISFADSSSPAVLRSPALFTAPIAVATIVAVSMATQPVEGIDEIWVRMHGTARDRRSERLARMVIEGSE